VSWNFEMSATAAEQDRALTITRSFDAPRALVWKAWTDPEHFLNWWGPRDHPAVDVEMDVRVGGRWRHCLRSTETGADLRHGGVFREVVEPVRLVFTFMWEEEGERGVETVVTVTFAERGGKTLMTFHQAPFQSDFQRDDHDGGWNSTFDRLAELLTSAKGSAS
jgi:uncharacterized protein YndB with AHSA1/START domain